MLIRPKYHLFGCLLSTSYFHWGHLGLINHLAQILVFNSQFNLIIYPFEFEFERVIMYQILLLLNLDNV